MPTKIKRGDTVIVDADNENGGYMATVVSINTHFARILEISEESDELSIAPDRLTFMSKAK